MRFIVDAYAFAGGVKHVGVLARDPRDEVAVVTFDVQGTTAVINRGDELIRLNLDAFEAEPVVLHKLGIGFIVEALPFGKRFVTVLHEHAQARFCDGEPHHVYALNVSPPGALPPVREDLGELREGENFGGLAANSGHVLLSTGAKLYHAHPPKRLEQVSLPLSPTIDAGSGKRFIVPALSECGTVAVDTKEGILVRGVDGW